MVFLLFFNLKLFLLRSQDVVKVFLEDMHLSLICSVKAIEVHYLLFSISFNIIVCLIKKKTPIHLWILTGKACILIESWCSHINSFNSLTWLNEALMSKLFKLFYFRNHRRSSILLKNCGWGSLFFKIILNFQLFFILIGNSRGVWRRFNILLSSYFSNLLSDLFLRHLITCVEYWMGRRWVKPYFRKLGSHSSRLL